MAVRFTYRPDGGRGVTLRSARLFLYCSQHASQSVRPRGARSVVSLWALPFLAAVEVFAGWHRLLGSMSSKIAVTFLLPFSGET